jgi:hypothetical protein
MGLPHLTPTNGGTTWDNNDLQGDLPPMKGVGRPSRRAKAAGTLKVQHMQETHTHIPVCICLLYIYIVYVDNIICMYLYIYSVCM